MIIFERKQYLHNDYILVFQRHLVGLDNILEIYKITEAATISELIPFTG